MKRERNSERYTLLLFILYKNETKVYNKKIEEDNIEK